MNQGLEGRGIGLKSRRREGGEDIKRGVVINENIIESRALYYAASSSSKVFRGCGCLGGAVGTLENPSVATALCIRVG
jgi:hypothetical protein